MEALIVAGKDSFWCEFRVTFADGAVDTTAYYRHPHRIYRDRKSAFEINVHVVMNTNLLTRGENPGPGAGMDGPAYHSP